MRLRDRVIRPKGGDRSARLAGLLENLGQLLYEPFVRDVRFTDRRQHGPHGALRNAQLAAGLGNFLIRPCCRGFDQCPDLLRRGPDCDVPNVYRFRVNFAELYSDVGGHGDRLASYFADRRLISARVSSCHART